MRIIFMGTPEFAVASLKSLVEGGYDIVGVITATDKFGGRGKKTLLESPVKRYAKTQNLTILQPPNLKNPQFVDHLRDLKADVQVVVAFRMLPEVVWDMPPLGTYNLHASLLPKYRGAAPINWAIIHGEEMTGLTTFKLKHEIDTGNLAFQVKVPILKSDSAGSLHDRLMERGASLILKTVKALKSGKIELFPQEESGITKAPKIYHQDCRIDFNEDAMSVYNYIRGLSPYPTAWTTLGAKKLKVFRASYTYENHDFEVGRTEVKQSAYLRMACSNGFIYCEEVQLEGKKRLGIQDFLNGLNPTMYN